MNILGHVSIQDPNGIEVTNQWFLGTPAYPACPSGPGKYTYVQNLLWPGCYICRESCSAPTPTPTPTTHPTQPPVTAPTTGIPANVPVADFTGTPLNGPTPLTVQFTDQSTNTPIAWEWDFGDGGRSIEQNPVHTYLNAGPHDVRMMASNMNGRDWEVKVGYVNGTASLPVAVNVLSVKSGDDEYSGDALLNTANIQSAMGYDSINIDGYALNVRERIRSLLSTSHILLINGHSTGGFIQVNKQNDEGYYGKALLPGEYEFEEIESYSNMDLAIFLGCNSGDPDYFHGNLVDVIGDKGGRCAMGWTEVLNVVIAPYYNTELWNQIQQSNTVYNSHLAARDAVAVDGFCQYLHQTNPDQYTEYCNQDTLYYRENDNGCHVALPVGIIPAKSSSQSIQTKNIEIIPSATSISQSIKTINHFARIPVTDVHYSATTHKTEGIVYEYTSDQSIFRVNEKNNRVQTARWFRSDLKKQKEIIDLDQGYVIAETFAREKYNEFWNTSETRDTKVITKKVLDSGRDRELQYEWWEIYYAPTKNTTPYSEIPGLNSVSVTVSPYNGNVIRYSEIYTPSVKTGRSPVNLTPAQTEEQAKQIAADAIQKLGISKTQLTGPESLGLRISSDINNYPHLVWNFKMTRSLKMGPKDHEFENREYAFVSVDAHDGTIVWSTPFG